VRDVHNCFAAFVAKNVTVDVAVPTLPGNTTLMSVFGWIVIHQHIGDNFDWQLPWADYKAGFGSIDADFWLGLEKMHLLTGSRAYRLRAEVQQETTGDWYSSEYWTFTIGDETNDGYRIDVDGYSGDANDGMRGCGWGDWAVLTGMMFTTYDQDNDDHDSLNCASGRGGGWWYNSCYCVCLTCNASRHEWQALPDGNHYLVTSRMMIKPRD